ncbi:hypothetical protein [Microbacterium sp. NPDC077184]|uniref:hypothetical protein n=1 Tax=Microbacterium sp. NPDC077184 TaxID=3154764 RepID=UPI0034407624
MVITDLYTSQIAYNPDTGQLVSDAVFQVYAPDDVSFTNPLALTEPASGVNIPTLRSSNIGVLPPFRVAGDLPEVVIRSGSFATLLSSRFGIFAEAGFDADQVQAAVDAVAGAEAAKGGAETARDEALAAKEAAEAVGTTNDAIMTAVAADPDSAFATQQRASIAAEAGPISALTRQRLAARAAYDAALSSGRCAVAASKATRVSESWANLSAWAVSGTSVQVFGGKLYGVSGGGGANRSFRVAPGKTARVVLVVNYLSGGTSGQGLFVGFNHDSAGSAPASGAANSTGVYFRQGSGSTDGVVNPINDGVQDIPNPVYSSLGSSTWTVTITVDENYLSIALATAAGGGQRRTIRWARNDSTMPLNNLSIMVNDSRGVSGMSVEAINEATIGNDDYDAFVTGLTQSPAVAAPGLHHGSVHGDGFLIMTPVGYDARRSYPAVMMFHGHGSDEKTWISNGNARAVADAFVAGGYVVVAAANTGLLSTWGAQAGIDAYTRAWQYARDHYNIGALGFYANSMGSIESLNALSQDGIPGVAAWVGTVPTFDLAENYANSSFTSAITSAYGISGGNYAAQTAGRDPALMNPLAFRGIPMWMLIATDDAVIDPVANGQALYASASEVANVTRVEVTGGHSTASIASQAGTMVAFMDSALGVRSSYAA